MKHEFDLASVDHVLNTTRSVRKRLDLSRPVPRKLVEEALEIALQAPTGANTQTWRFLVVEDQEKREKIADFYQRGVQLYVDGETGLSRTGVTINKEFEATDLRHSQKRFCIRFQCLSDGAFGRSSTFYYTLYRISV